MHACKGWQTGGAAMIWVLLPAPPGAWSLCSNKNRSPLCPHQQEQKTPVQPPPSLAPSNAIRFSWPMSLLTSVLPLSLAAPLWSSDLTSQLQLAQWTVPSLGTLLLASGTPMLPVPPYLLPCLTSYYWRKAGALCSTDTYPLSPGTLSSTYISVNFLSLFLSFFLNLSMVHFFSLLTF